MTAAAVQAARDAQRRAAPWPYADLTTDHLPRPVGQVVLKVHQRCNLACDYCYVYELADQSWRDRPATMSPEVWQATLDELTRHVERHALTRLTVVLHGGEPLLLGAARLDALAAGLRAAVPAGCDLEIGLQTNGVLLDEAKAEVLRRHRIRAGVSVDGLPADHDRHRLTTGGRTTSAAVARALDLLGRPENREIFAGILCTVSPATDPKATLGYLMSFQPPAIDVLLPHANWETPPDEPFADWLITAFDTWYDTVAPPRVRLFDDLLALLLGGAGRSEQLGLSPVALAVIETDGTIELVDSLKSAYPGAAVTGLDIRHDRLDDLLTDPGYLARQIGVEALSDECRRCPVRDICGGGHYVHRYRAGLGFRNPSVYCADLKQLITHAYGRVTEDLRERAGATG